MLDGCVGTLRILKQNASEAAPRSASVGQTKTYRERLHFKNHRGRLVQVEARLERIEWKSKGSELTYPRSQGASLNGPYRDGRCAAAIDRRDRSRGYCSVLRLDFFPSHDF
jgi:hypothetical protein